MLNVIHVFPWLHLLSLCQFGPLVSLLISLQEEGITRTNTGYFNEGKKGKHVDLSCWNVILEYQLKLCMNLFILPPPVAKVQNTDQHFKCRSLDLKLNCTRLCIWLVAMTDWPDSMSQYHLLMMLYWSRRRLAQSVVGTVAVFQTKKQKPRYVYKTAQELIESGGKQRRKAPSVMGPKVKVIDMTGKEKRVLSGEVYLFVLLIRTTFILVWCQAWFDEGIIFIRMGM